MMEKRAPPYTMYDFTPSTVPGCRTPHVWLRDGRSLYDAMGIGFTLLRFDRSVPVDALTGAAAKRGVPLAVLDVEADAARAPTRTSSCCRAPISTSPGVATRSRTNPWH